MAAHKLLSRCYSRFFDGGSFLIPERMGEIEYRHSMGLAASLMLGWTFLLIWADQKPVERKGILLLTIFPVISGLLSAGIFGVVMELIPFSIPSIILE